MVNDPVQSIVILHSSYQQHAAKRLQQFSEVVQACPALLQDEYRDQLLIHGKEMVSYKISLTNN